MKYKIVVLRQVTERAWFEISGVNSVEEALAAYKNGEGLETGCKHLSTDFYLIEEVFEEDTNALRVERA
jgi:hypothetical protein